jgi:glutamine amidotransferase
MRVAVIDYGSGNLRSASKALEHVADAATRIVVTDSAQEAAVADRIVLPGVGAFADCMRGLASLPGMIETLNKVVIERGRPFFGICVGLQLLARAGHEHVATPGLGWLGGEVVGLAGADGRRIDPGTGATLKVPHMGWNALAFDAAGHPLLAGIAPGAQVYFVHSYHLTLDDPADRIAHCDYGGPIVAIAGRGNVAGTQFHPEKSQRVGLRLLANFLAWKP